MKVIGRLPPEHSCTDELPRNRMFRKNPLCVEGMMVECSCGKVYVWAYWGYSETWGWRQS